MQIVVLGNAVLKSELIQDTTDNSAEVVWVEDIHQFSSYPNAHAFIDLQFENTEARKSTLKDLLPRTVIINSVAETLAESAEAFTRINAWPTFLKGHTIEATCLQAGQQPTVERVFKHFGKSVEWLPDVAGFVTPRVVSMIINEAYFALAEGVSTPAEIDTALKLGTAYPYGPFEWSEKIGLQNIATLLTVLSQQQKRYTPAPLLLHEVNKAI